MLNRVKMAPKGAVIAVFILAMLAMGCTPQGQADIDTDAIAGKLVAQCANIGEGDFVYISAGVRDVKLLEDIAIHVRKQGAFPLMGLASERYNRRYYDEVPARYDSQSPELRLALTDIFTAQISVDFAETPDLLSDVPAGRRAAVGKATVEVNARARERNINFVNLGNDLYPTNARAEQYGMSRDELSAIFWDGVNVDYSEIQSSGEQMKAVLASGSVMHITHPNGTDLMLGIAGRSVLVSDGVISDEEKAQGGAACQVWLPAGEVYLVPVPGSAQGTFTAERYFYQGTEIRDLTLTCDAGKLTSMTADAGLDDLKKRYEAAGTGKDLFAVVDIGLNPNVNIPDGSRMVAWMPAGMVTVGVGTNTWAGGDNNVDFGVYTHLSGCTVKIDDNTIVEDGKLAL